MSENLWGTVRRVCSRKARVVNVACLLLPLRLHWSAVALGVLMCVQTATAQVPSKSPGNTATYYDLGRVPTQLREHFKLLGDRLQKQGKERVSLTGSLTTPAGTSPVQIVLENGGKLRLQSDGKDVTFDGTRPQQTVANQTDGSLLEALIDDLPDTLMEYVSQGMAFHVIGRGFRDGRGGLCDLYDVATPTKTNADLHRLKRYCFDSSTLLLRSVQYVESGASNAPLLETRFEDWRQVNGQAVPARVIRVENGVTLFTVQAQTVAISARINDTLFGQN